jgi:hypothetical protein
MKGSSEAGARAERCERGAQVELDIKKGPRVKMMRSCAKWATDKRAALAASSPLTVQGYLVD